MSDRFSGMSIEEYLARLGSGDPAPGGGAAAALTSAQGAALIMMVANHTVGKPAYSKYEELNKDALTEAAILRDKLAGGIEKDAEAFSKVSAAYAMPGGSEDEAALRAAAIASASVEAAETPLMVMSDSLEALRLAAELKGRSNKNLESDIYVAARCLYAGIRCAEHNVDANLPAIKRADPARASEMRHRAAEILKEAKAIMADLSVTD